MNDLKNTELFRDVSEDAIAQVLSTSRICSLDARQALATTRDKIGYLYVITEGYVSIWTPPNFDSRLDMVFLAWRGPQQIIGELREIGDAPSTTIIKTYEPCEFIELRLDSFLDLAKTVAMLYRNIANLVWKKMWSEGRRSEVVQMNPALRQVAQTILLLAQDRCKDFSFDELKYKIPGTIHQNELAGFAGLTRERVNLKMNLLRDLDILEYNGKKGSSITILNLPKLRKIVAPEKADIIAETKLIVESD